MVNAGDNKEERYNLGNSLESRSQSLNFSITDILNATYVYHFLKINIFTILLQVSSMAMQRVYSNESSLYDKKKNK